MENQTTITEEQAILNKMEQMTIDIHNGDVDAVINYYEPSAVVVFEPNQPIFDHQVLREMFSGIMEINPCRCANKTAGFVRAGYVDPINLLFQKDILSKVEDQIENKLDNHENKLHKVYQNLFQEQPFIKSPDAVNKVKALLESKVFKDTFELN